MGARGDSDSDAGDSRADRDFCQHLALPMGKATGASDNRVDGTSEQWYLKIDDKEYGPVTRPEMEYFLRPPRLCSQLRVMCTTQKRVWHSIARHETLDKVLLRFGIAAGPTALNVPQLPTPSGPSMISKFMDGFGDCAERVFSWGLRNRVLLAVVLLFVTINTGFLIAMRNRDREILNRYEFTWKSVQQLALENAPNVEWRKFAEQACIEVESLQKELTRTSISGPPVRRQLLTLGRDCLLKILKNDTPVAAGSDQAKYFEQQLKILNDQIPIN